MYILLLILGLVLIIAGANFLTDGAATVAARFGISEFMVGLTVVAIGTSTPELVVSTMSAAAGNSDLAVGNVLGSNLFNVLFILGATALVKPLPLTGNNLRKDIPFVVLSSVVFLLMVSDVALDGQPSGLVTRSEGLILLCLFVVFMAYTIFSSKVVPLHPNLSNHDVIASAKADEDPHRHGHKLWLSVLMIVGGLAGLVFGGDLFVDNAVVLARKMGISESVIAITLLAGGTSLPELAASIVATAKGKTGIALGNVIGSNITNVFLVLGASAVVSPLSLGTILPVDVMVLVGVSLILLLTAFTFRKHRIDRAEGAIFLVLYVAYIAWLLNR